MHLEDKDKIIDFLQIISTFCTLVATSREPLGIEYGEPYELRHFNSEEAWELFIKNSPVKSVGVSEEHLLKSEILEGLLGNHPLAIKLIASAMPKGKTLLSLRDDLISSNDLFENDFQDVFDCAVDENIERQESIFNCISYSYQQLNENERNVFNALSLFPDGLPLSQLKIIGREKDFINSNKNYVQINDKVVKSLQDKSLIENRNDMQCQHAMLRRYAEANIIRSENKKSLYKKAFTHNFTLVSDLYNKFMEKSEGSVDHSVYFKANKIKNNFVHIIRYFGQYAGECELQIKYLYMVSVVLAGCDHFQQLSRAVQGISEDFTCREQDELFLNILDIQLRYYHGDFVGAYEELLGYLSADDALLLDLSDISIKYAARSAMDISNGRGYC